MRFTRTLCIMVMLTAVLALAACGQEDQRAANCAEFGTLFRIEYSESAGISVLTPYQWGGLEIAGCALLVPPGSNVFSLIMSSDTPTLSVYDALVYDGDSTMVGAYEEGMSADEWVEKALSGTGSASAVTSMTLSNKDNAAGTCNDGGSMTYLGAYVSSGKAYMCVLTSPSSYTSENASSLVGAEKDLAAMAKSAVGIPLVPKE